MTLMDLFQPRPTATKGRVVMPLGAWPESPKPMNAEEREARRKESWHEYAEKNREQRIAYMRAYRARKAA